MDLEIVDVPEQHRYEARLGAAVAGFIDYRAAGAERTFRHTQVVPEFEGRGVGGALARAALDDLRARSLTVRPLCPFVAGWIQRHPEYLDVVTPG
ncbi:GNAT family N-acetyltransferase [Actinophytocola sp.]|uniref:GNAT family N-acetyltransferase n=1 Tax=Actinophytocola sp. TaxID=1872138 RepID=UPI002D7E707F|nr:GNAT family N-acetyltransferase [Actinophytocola sp.]HET9143739.1 GNAT family N-acetyltransferase [Actinophytocola sp.]HEU5107351.1 GNAT family N-acetyltransferase [Micromonosporaceae bacterium]